MEFDVNAVRKNFPILGINPRGKRLVYLDNAATTQKPQCVIDAISVYYSKLNANIHRGVHYLSDRATEAYETARRTVQKFIHAGSPEECIFLKSNTEAINLVAQCFGEAFVKKGDEILITALEHHSNIVPWQVVCKQKGAHLKVAPISNTGELLLSELEKLLTSKTKILAITHVSNVLGTLNPIKDIVKMAHQKNIPVLVDGAQSAPHIKIDVQDLDCDFFTFSGHKVYGPTGVGVLYGKAEWLEKLPPYQTGGGMISTVGFELSTYQKAPMKFEAGGLPIADAIGLGVALTYLSQFPEGSIEAYERELTCEALNLLQEVPELKILGPFPNQANVISFTMTGIHPHDIGTILDQHGVAVRTGHHCAMPLMEILGVPATTRMSIGIYNTKEDIEQLIFALLEVNRLFKGYVPGAHFDDD